MKASSTQQLYIHQVISSLAIVVLLPMAADFSLFQPLHATHNTPLLATKLAPSSWPKQSFSCRSHLSGGPTGGSGGDKDKERGQERKRSRWGLLVAIHSEAGKLGRRLKESLSPKQKGDWKDLVLMSFSFAVYVYIAQKIVRFYCAWMSMIN